jgi:hypothetical protein
LPVVAKGKFTGEIKGARAVRLDNRKGFNSSTIEEIVHKKQMSRLANEILVNETKAIKAKIAADPELRGFELISEDRAVQYMTLGEVLVKLSKTAMGQRYRKLKEDHVDILLNQMDEFIETIPALANLGKRSRGSDGDLRVNRIRRRKEQKTMDERHEARLKQEAEQQQTIDEVTSEYSTPEEKAKSHINKKLNGKEMVEHLTMIANNEMSAEEHKAHIQNSHQQ